MNNFSVPYRKRCKRYDIPGHAHYLTFSCYQRQPFLSLDVPRQWLVEAVAKARKEAAFDLWAYVIMPEHAHLLVWPRGGTTMSEILRAVKLPVAKRALLWAQRENLSLLESMKHCGHDGKVAYRFWQRGGGYDRNLRSPRDVHEKINYIHANPVRRGLVAHPRDWPWSSWSQWHGGSVEQAMIDKDGVPSGEV